MVIYNCSECGWTGLIEEASQGVNIFTQGDKSLPLAYPACPMCECRLSKHGVDPDLFIMWVM